MTHLERIREKLTEADALLITEEKNQRGAGGFAFTDGYVLVSREKAWLLTDPRYTEAAEASVGPDVTVLRFDSTHPKLPLLKRILEEEKVERLAAEDRHLSYAAFRMLEQQLGRTLLPAGDLLPALRASKDEEELRLMREAQAIADKALEETLPYIRAGMSEKEVAAELVYRMLRNGSEKNSFDPIVVTGQNSSLPHGVPGDRLLREGDFLTIDFGCVYGGYCSDTTRTFAVGSATEEMKNLYALVLEAQLAGIRAARSGISGKEIDEAARKVIRDAGFGDFFGHGFGHSLGLDIHEQPVLNQRGERLMPDGAVVSAEPGIYLPGRFGLRIEDVMILRPDGSEVITKSPKDRLIVL